jgi:tetratricopeptide (TPR) repeat protein
MSQFSRSVVLLTLSTLLGLQTTPLLSHTALAQAPDTCNPNQSQENDLANQLNTARESLDRGNSTTALNALQTALPLTNSLKPSAVQPSFISEWLIDDPGTGSKRFEKLIQIADSTQLPQLRSQLTQFAQLTQRLSPSYRTTRALGFAAIARAAIVLQQPQLASQSLTQATETARTISEAAFRTDSLLEIAAGYAAIAQPQTAQTLLAQVEPLVPKLSPTDQINRTLRLATIYAQAGNDRKAIALAAKLAKTPEAQANAQLEIVRAYLKAKKFEATESAIATIKLVTQRAAATGELAIAYEAAKQPVKATQRFQQALQLAKSNADSTVRDPMLKTLALNYLQAGRRDEARQLLQAYYGLLYPTVVRPLILADVQAKQPDKVRQLLSQTLPQIAEMDDPWRRSELGNLIAIATDTQQFDWILKEWPRIAKIDYGLQDFEVEKIATTYAQNGRHVQALNWVQQLPIANRPVLQLKLPAAIARVAHQSGQTTWARNLLQTTDTQIDALTKAAQDRLKQSGGDTLEPIDIQYTGHAAIALVFAQIGDSDTSRQLLTRVMQFNDEMGDTGIGGRIDNPFELFMNARQAIGALQIANATQNPDGRQLRLQSAAGLLLAQNRFDLVMPIVNQLKAESAKTGLLLAIAQRYSELRQPDRALPILTQAFEVAKTIPGDESQFDHLGADGGTVIPIETDRGSRLEAIAIQYTLLKQPTQALKVVNTLQDKQTRSDALAKVKCAG